MLNSAVEFIKEKIGDFKPQIGIILGSGLGDLADEYCLQAIPYSGIPGLNHLQFQDIKASLFLQKLTVKKLL